jgi:hypothetical protein
MSPCNLRQIFECFRTVPLWLVKCMFTAYIVLKIKVLTRDKPSWHTFLVWFHHDYVLDWTTLTNSGKQNKKICDACQKSHYTTQHNTKQYINCTITVTNGAHKLLWLSQQQSPNRSPNTLPLLHLAISRALSGSETVHSASFNAFKKT